MSLDPTSGASRRDEAREKAKQIREQHRKQQRKTRLIVIASVVALVLVVGTGGTFYLLNSRTPTGPGPVNMRSDGIVIGSGSEAVRTSATPAGQEPIATPVDEESDVISIQMYVDYLCPICKTFEETNGDQIATWLDSGVATVEIHPIPLLDRFSQGTKYSTRAVNAAACVANSSPDQFYAFHQRLFVLQPEEGTPGLSDEELVAAAKDSKVSSLGTITTCITEQRFRPWVNQAKERAQTGPIPNSDVVSVSGTPTIIVNGQQYKGAADDAQAFRQFVVKAAGTSFNESSTPTPTPTPSAEVPAG